jgi:hypothetical protein
MLHGTGAMARAARTARTALGLAGCAALAACASAGKNGADAPFDFLPLFADTGGTSADGTATAAAGDGESPDQAGAAAQMADGPASPGDPTTGDRQMNATPAREADESAGAGSDSQATAELTPRYCYRTLAEVDCYLEPQPDRRRQRVGSFHGTVQ